MKALGVDAVPVGDERDWLCEIKFDGYRGIAVINDGDVELWSRNQKPLDYPELVPALRNLRCRNAVIDGEIVALDAQGRTSFQTLQGRDIGDRPPIVFYLFDLLFLNGRSLTSDPIETRREKLQQLLAESARSLQLSPVFDVAPAVFMAKSKEQGFEGIVLKRRASTYEPNHRSGSWIKIKNRNEQEFVIGGFTPPRNTRQYFGAILIGYYENKELMYAGKVGTGFDGKLLKSLHDKFLPLVVDKCPFTNLPLGHHSRFGQGMTPAIMRTVTWLKPTLVAQIKFSEWTLEGLLRQPVFLGLRKDKAASSVKRESSAA